MDVTTTLEVGAHCVAFRSAGPADADFLLAVYASAREAELAPVPWSAEDKARFIAQQFHAQTAAYRQNYPGAAFLIITVDGVDAGRLYLHPRAQEIRIMDIALLPPYRNRGFGSAVLRHVLADGENSGCAVTIHVEVFNPALRLYERLGFRRAGATEVYLLMERRAGVRAQQ